MIPARGTRIDQEEKASSGGFRMALVLAGPLIAAAFVAGLSETTTQSLLPLYGLAHAMTDAEAARLVAVFSFGEAILVGIIGFLADRFGRRLMLRSSAVAALLTIILLAFAKQSDLAFASAIFLAGGTISGIYTLGLIVIGQDFRGQQLAIVSTGFAMAYSAGAVLGSMPVGLAFDVFGPDALLVFIGASFLGFVALLLLPRMSGAHSLATGPEPAVGAPSG